MTTHLDGDRPLDGPLADRVVPTGQVDAHVLAAGAQLRVYRMLRYDDQPASELVTNLLVERVLRLLGLDRGHLQLIRLLVQEREDRFFVESAGVYGPGLRGSLEHLGELVRDRVLMLGDDEPRRGTLTGRSAVNSRLQDLRRWGIVASEQIHTSDGSSTVNVLDEDACGKLVARACATPGIVLPDELLRDLPPSLQQAYAAGRAGGEPPPSAEQTVGEGTHRTLSGRCTADPVSAGQPVALARANTPPSAGQPVPMGMDSESQPSMSMGARGPRDVAALYQHGNRPEVRQRVASWVATVDGFQGASSFVSDLDGLAVAAVDGIRIRGGTSGANLRVKFDGPAEQGTADKLSDKGVLSLDGRVTLARESLLAAADDRRPRPPLVGAAGDRRDDASGAEAPRDDRSVDDGAGRSVAAPPSGDTGTSDVGVPGAVVAVVDRAGRGGLWEVPAVRSWCRGAGGPSTVAEISTLADHERDAAVLHLLLGRDGPGAVAAARTTVPDELEGLVAQVCELASS